MCVIQERKLIIWKLNVLITFEISTVDIHSAPARARTGRRLFFTGLGSELREGAYLKNFRKIDSLYFLEIKHFENIP